MSHAFFRFYAELNDFLPPVRQRISFLHGFAGTPAVKDLIEALGVPHSEVDLILVNGESVDFFYRVHDGDRISVYPVFESMDITPLSRVRPRPLRETRFVLDTHLGRLAAYLRLLGFDTLYRNDFPDRELAQISSRERRILLTRDRGLLKRSAVTHGYCLRETEPRRQVVEVLRRFDLFGSIRPFQRCLCCNSGLRSVPKAAVHDRLPAATREQYDEFYLCPACDRVYWKGSHYDRMSGFVEQVVREAGVR
jgi:uncharacterized protein with PIN domain